MVDISFSYLDWDDEQLGIRCGLMDGMHLEGTSNVDGLGDVVIDCIEAHDDVDFVTLKLPQNTVSAVNRILHAGAQLIDTELTFAFSVNTPPPVVAADPALTCTFCKTVESAPFLSLAEEMRHSRFFRDERIPAERALRLWQSSIANHCEGYADQLLVAYYAGKPSGLITLARKNADTYFMHIVGVLKPFQGKKIATGMIYEVVRQYSHEYSIYVETQSTNLPAQMLYQKAGFSFHRLKYVLHYWRNPITTTWKSMDSSS
ncbi:MAG: GNAT family N-acetyltransferase [Candidatus Omnitrophota bacterium]|jgi:ribosomal protein S18 acetylase RimI-like enzyme|nr:MAG: GNAT family N-acetyltransferase [Candidatus Omnitrophota bacterium]